jgi:hypothetical protein
VVGSLLLGLYDSDGFLHHVGFTSTIPRDDKKSADRQAQEAHRTSRMPVVRRYSNPLDAVDSLDTNTDARARRHIQPCRTIQSLPLCSLAQFHPR